MSATMFGADSALPLWDEQPVEGAFTITDAGVVGGVARPWLFGFAPANPTGAAMLVLGGGGYTQLMVEREGVAVARWLNGLGIHAYVLVHRFPTADTGPMAPRADAIRAMAMIRAHGHGQVGVVGLSSGGHLAACLLAAGAEVARPDVAVIGYAPISTNAAGRTVIADKPPLPPVEKQALYDRLQPDAQLADAPPPVFIVYAGNDPVVPVANAYRLKDALVAKGGAPELHVFADAPHGFALDTKTGPVRLWPELCAAWLRQVDFVPKA
ncbi:alpha/beta hydrolase [Sphingomonas mollis]|uniref:Dienelactone hydrolase family protein n=1 Tax=Sphingomonas mollis TaxID=2795726 RepID=A0ABS0XKG7_9SPHN|nr:alpha/beta hydrolase [Sphingomonas sp. BT553]MBJ6120526.1 dienelactone hydrolase family protein [Sphingomonas sp. BT553]